MIDRAVLVAVVIFANKVGQQIQSELVHHNVAREALRTNIFHHAPVQVSKGGLLFDHPGRFERKFPDLSCFTYARDARKYIRIFIHYCPMGKIQ
jgi:hypothetical protein